MFPLPPFRIRSGDLLVTKPSSRSGDHSGDQRKGLNSRRSRYGYGDGPFAGRCRSVTRHSTACARTTAVKTR
jgi:hypothetical protein